MENNKAGGNSRAKKSSSRRNKYTLRAQNADAKKKQPRKRGPKPRPKPLPMSKYRRRTANMRERQRMGEINVAFEKLRAKIPSLAVAVQEQQDEEVRNKCEKMTKINILHVAINYIRALENILDTGDAGVNIYGTAVVQSPFLPLAVKPEMPPSPVEVPSKKTTRKKKKREMSASSTLTTASSCSSLNSTSSAGSGGGGGGGTSSSDDSGIMDEDEECPDWTQLTSTLDFPSTDSSPSPPPPPSNTKIVLLPQPSSNNAVPPPPRGNLDTLLTFSSLLPTSPIKELEALQWSEKKLPLANNTKLLNRQNSFPDLGEDIFSDLNSSFESMDSVSVAAAADVVLNFVQEDPFQLVI